MIKPFAQPRAKVLIALTLTSGAVAWLASWFIVPTLWAAYIATGIWPIYARTGSWLARRFPRIGRQLPVLVSLGVLLAIAVVLWLSIQAGLEEARNWGSGEAIAGLKANFQSSRLRQLLEGVPVVGAKISRSIQAFDPIGDSDGQGLSGMLFEGGGQWSRQVFTWVAASLYCAIALAALLRHGAKAWPPLRAEGSRLLGPAFAAHLSHQTALTRSIFNSIVVLGLIEAFAFCGPSHWRDCASQRCSRC